jgi:NADPH:quinone reductase
MKGLSFHQLSLGSGHRYGPGAEAKLRLAGESFSELVVSGVIKVHLSKVISLGEVGDALLEMLKQRTVGKVVMKVQWQ